MYYTKDLKARVVGIKKYTGTSKEGKEYSLHYANVIYESERDNVVGNEIGSYLYNYGKINLEVGKEYTLNLVGSKKENKIYYEIMSANDK